MSLSTLNQITATNHILHKTIKRITNNNRHDYFNSDSVIAVKMKSQVDSSCQVMDNVQNLQAMLKTADGALSNTLNLLTSIREELVASLNGTHDDHSLSAIQQSINEKLKQINDNMQVEYNGQKLFDDSKKVIRLNDDYENINLHSLDIDNLKISAGDSSSLEAIDNLIDKNNGALDTLTTIGSQITGLDYEYDNLSTVNENTSNASEQMSAMTLEDILQMKNAELQNQLAIYGHKMASDIEYRMRKVSLLL